MAAATPTLIPRESVFPRLLPRPPQPHPVPLTDRRVYTRVNVFRDLQREMDDLSDEENEINNVHNRGFSFLIPIGRTLTRQEEKNDADEDSDDSQSMGSGGVSGSVMEDDGENESAQDLDASMEDLDEDLDDEDEAMEGEEYEEEPSET
ncbi:hypothetical protein D9619_005951 [Psilocybe cf. subviscida]|uniref:Uncharacterized protein n=1 Tax=Psilocybe cf. subviscida TaxID=2480587 RepID=A0A8H5BY26_9AGAR|nr:hypothetical protein D9619_005951 [Psilocybe cf. subviscida]